MYKQNRKSEMLLWFWFLTGLFNAICFSEVYCTKGTIDNLGTTLSPENQA